MKRLQPLVFSAALLLLAACGENTQPEAAAPSFSFSIDPGSETVSLQGSGAAAFSTLTYGVCGLDDPRPLLPEGELALTAYNAVFLPGNILEITAEFTNVTGFDFEQPFTFTRAGLSRNIVSSQEPEVTDADLGSDGVLSPDEATSTLTFTVEHMGQPFVYKVLAEAMVRCGDGDPTDPTAPVDPTDPTDATDPSDPTDATDPTDPTDATDPTEPTDPTDATDPTDPTDATDPTDPTDATDPTEPTDPTDATDPTDPTDPGVTACVVSEGVTQDGNTITGTDGDDTIDCTGVEDDKTIDGRGGNDTITGGNGDDVLIGRVGNDTITGGPGNDCISGGDGNDTLTGSAGFNTIFEGPGEDTVSDNTDPEGDVTGCTTDPAG